jgi:hypothetical protein
MELGLKPIQHELNDEEKKQMQDVPYSNAVGSLIYLAICTRPDIAYAVSVVSRFMKNPGQEHWKMVKRIIQYINGTKDMQLNLGGKDLNLQGYCDSDWGGCHDSRRSTTGFVFTLGIGAITWKSRRQPTVALSTTESEYMAMSDATKELIWLRGLYEELIGKLEKPTILFCDNQGCIKLAKNPIQHARTKHIDIRHHFIRHKVQDGTFEPVYIDTKDMPADMMTKALPSDTHWRHSKAIGLRKKSASGSVKIDECNMAISINSALPSSITKSTNH